MASLVDATIPVAASAGGTSPGGGGRTFEAVQILRGIAAAMVVFHHMCYALIEYHPRHSAIAGFHKLADLGAGGVDIFFCISGFVISHSARKLPAGSAAAGTFARRRLLRVLPPYWIFTAVLIALWASGAAFKGLVMTPGLIVCSLLLIPYPKRTLDGVVKYHPILDVGWTLTYEMYFYACCTAIVRAAGGRAFWPWILPLLAIGAAASLAIGGWNSTAASLIASPLLFEFALGVAIARFAAGRHAPRAGAGLIAIGSLLLAASIFLADPMAWRVLWWGVPGAMLVLGCVLIEVNRAEPLARLGVFLGTASYSIYLAHPLFVLVVGTVLKKGHMTHINPDLLLPVLTIGTVAATALSYFVVEGPLMRLLRPRSKTVAMAHEVGA